jgi:hypothetical protein
MKDERPKNEFIHGLIEWTHKSIIGFFLTSWLIGGVVLEECFLHMSDDMESVTDEGAYFGLFLICFLIDVGITACLIGVHRWLTKTLFPKYLPYHYLTN